MKPLKLTIEGVNSFIEKQEIDFTPLTRSGIFGVFGRTGSGKSTVLDCIMLALYGKMDRTRRLEDFVNKSCTRAAVTFTFVMQERGVSRTYLVEREYRLRKSQNISDGRLYEVKGDALFSLAEKVDSVNEKLLEIIGIGQDDFKKCIALPQGEFASLLSATHKEQTEIVGKLFSLERFGETLTRRINEKLRTVKADSERLEREIEALGDVSAAFGDSLKAKLKELQAASERLTVQTAEKSAALLSLRQRREKSEKLLQAKQELSGMDDREAEIAASEERLERYRSALPLFPLLEAAERAGSQLEQARTALERAQSGFEAAQAAGRAVTEAYPERSRDLNDALKELTLRCGKLAGLEERAGRYDEWKRKIDRTRADYRQASEKVKQLEAEARQGQEALAKEQSRRETLSCACEKLAEQLKTLTERTLAAGERAAFCEIEHKLAADRAARPGLEEYIEELRRYVQTRLSALEALSPADAGELRAAQAEYDQSLRQLSACEGTLSEQKLACEKLASGLKLTAQTAETLLHEGKALKDQREELERAFLDAGVADPAQYRAEREAAEQSRKGLEQQIAALEKERSDAETRLQQAREALTQAQAVEKRAAGEHQAAQARLSEALAREGIAAAEELRARSLGEDERERAERKTKEFRNRQKHLDESVRELAAELDGKPVSAEEVAAAQAECDRLKAEERQNTVDTVEWTNRRQKYLENRERHDALKREKKRLDRELDLVTSLYSLCKGSELMNFAAEEYFREISASASQRLADLTDGRYQLVYRKNFVILDNLNGGQERDVKTLSGGETFLVSLCLAVSLSEAIVNLSARPLDFFFLDEGFGTLDQELFDTVISSLEKLKDTHFTIGLISHVPELRHRFSAKLLVHSATQTHGSTVEIVTD